MKFKIGDVIRIIDPVPTPGGKWAKSGALGIVKEATPIMAQIADLFSIETELEYHYDLELWFEYDPARTWVEYSVPESIIELRS